MVGSTTFNITNPTAGGTTLLTLGTINNGANNITFTGNGSAAQSGVWGSGAGSVTLDSSFTGVATLSQANTYTGGTTVNGGTLRAANSSAFGPAASSVVVNSGGTLDVNGTNLSNYNPTITGTGVGGNGAIFNSGAAQTTALTAFTLAGNASIGGGPGAGQGGANRWDVRGAAATITGGGFDLTKVGPNYIAFASTLAGTVSVNNVGNINVNAGTLALEGNATVNNSTAGSITINTGGTLSIGNWGSTTGVVINKPIVMAGGTLQTDNATANGNAAIPSTTAISLNNTGLIVAQAGSLLTLNGVIADGTSANGITVSGGGGVSLINSNTYTGTTNVASGGILSVGAYTTGAARPGPTPAWAPAR